MFPAKARCRVVYGEFLPHPIHLHSAISSNAQSWAGAEGFPSQKQMPTTEVIVDRWSMTKLMIVDPCQQPKWSLIVDPWQNSDLWVQQRPYVQTKVSQKKTAQHRCVMGAIIFKFSFFSRWWEHFWMFKDFVQKFQKVLWWILLRWLSQLLRGLLRSVLTWSSR